MPVRQGMRGSTDIAGVGYQMGWVEVGQKNPPIVGGWMRQVAPAVILPDYSVSLAQCSC